MVEILKKYQICLLFNGFSFLNSSSVCLGAFHVKFTVRFVFNNLLIFFSKSIFEIVSNE